MSTPLRFGPELRRLRLEAGLSLKALSTALAYDKGHLSKVERGGRSPSPDLARRCDAFLGVGGELQRLVIDPEPAPAADADTTGVRLSRDPGAVGRRAVLAAGTGTLIDLSLSPSDRAPSADDPLLTSFRTQFDQLRMLGQSTSPAALLPLLAIQTRTVTGLAAGAPATTRSAAFLLASRFAEFIRWMAQEA